MIFTKDMSSTPRSIRWAPRTVRGTVICQSAGGTVGDCSIKVDSELVPALQRRRSFSEFFTNKKKFGLRENEIPHAETFQSRNWIRSQVKKIVTHLSPSKRREVRHMKSEGAIGSLYNSNLELPVEVLFQQSAQQPPSYAEDSFHYPIRRAKPKLDCEPVCRDAKANMKYMRVVKKRLEATPGTVQWQDRMLQISRSLRKERRNISIVNTQLIEWILEDSLPLRSQNSELAEYPLVDEFDLLFMPVDVVRSILQEADFSPVSFGSGKSEGTFFNTQDPIDAEVLTLDLFSDKPGVINILGSRITTPSVTAEHASDDDDDEYDANEVAKKYARCHPIKSEECKREAPGIIVMGSLPYYAVDESSSSDDSSNVGSLVFPLQDSASETYDKFRFGHNAPFTKQSTGLRKVSKKISLVDFFQSQGILKTEATLQSRSSAPTKRHESSKLVDDTNLVTNHREDSEGPNMPGELVDHQEFLRRFSTASTEVDLDFGEPLEKFGGTSCGQSICNIRCGRHGKEDTTLEPISQKPVVAYL